MKSETLKSGTLKSGTFKLVLALSASLVAGACTTTESRLAGAGAGAVVGGPIGAAVGGVAGAVAGPSVARTGRRGGEY